MQKIEVSTGTIWKTIIILLLLGFLFFIRDILLLLLFSLVVVSAALPLVDKLEKKKIPRPVATLGIFFAFFVILGFLLFLIMPRLVTEFKQLGDFLPQYFISLEDFFQNVSELALSHNINNVQQLINNLSNGLTNSISEIFSNSLVFLKSLLKIVVVISLSFYMLVKKNGTDNLIESFTPQKHRFYVTNLIQRIQQKMGRWLFGQILLILSVFFLDYLALLLLDVPFALILALWGGLLEIIPYIGPTLALIPAVLIAFSISPLTSLLLLIAYLIIQNMEAYILVPLIMKKAVGLNPVIIILSLLIGAKLGGVLGIVLAVPVATAIGVFVGDILDKKEDEEVKDE